MGGGPFRGKDENRHMQGMVIPQLMSNYCFLSYLFLIKLDAAV